VLLTFIDNRTSKAVEIRKSWRLDQVIWGSSFRNIIRRMGENSCGAYEVDADSLDDVEPIDDPINIAFRRRELVS